MKKHPAHRRRDFLGSLSERPSLPPNYWLYGPSSPFSTVRSASHATTRDIEQAVASSDTPILDAQPGQDNAQRMITHGQQPASASDVTILKPSQQPVPQPITYRQKSCAGDTPVLEAQAPPSNVQPVITHRASPTEETPILGTQPQPHVQPVITRRHKPATTSHAPVLDSSPQVQQHPYSSATTSVVIGLFRNRPGLRAASSAPIAVGQKRPSASELQVRNCKIVDAASLVAHEQKSICHDDSAVLSEQKSTVTAMHNKEGASYDVGHSQLGIDALDTVIDQPPEKWHLTRHIRRKARVTFLVNSSACTFH